MSLVTFLGVTALTYLNQLSSDDREFYTQYLIKGDTNYYQCIDTRYKNSKKLALISKHEIEQCVLIAAYLNHTNPMYIRTVMQIECGWPTAVVHGDYGIMQINRSIWTKELKKSGVTLDWKMIADNPCQNIYLGTYILAGRIKKAANDLEGIANYHRYLTTDNPLPHLQYRIKATQKLSELWKERLVWLHHYEE